MRCRFNSFRMPNEINDSWSKCHVYVELCAILFAELPQRQVQAFQILSQEYFRFFVVILKPPYSYSLSPFPLSQPARVSMAKRSSLSNYASTNSKVPLDNVSTMWHEPSKYTENHFCRSACVMFVSQTFFRVFTSSSECRWVALWQFRQVAHDASHRRLQIIIIYFQIAFVWSRWLLFIAALEECAPHGNFEVLARNQANQSRWSEVK